MSNIVIKRQSEISIVKTKGGRKKYQYSGDGRWNNEAISQVMLMSDPNKWFSINELAQLAFRSATPTNQRKARERIALLWHHLFKHHSKVLIKEWERKQSDIRIVGKMRKTPLKGRNVIARVKLASYKDKEVAKSELNERWRHNEITRAQLESMMDSLLQLTGPESKGD